ncbi:hypothetical protein F66182_18129 [Fusarium sp. NRRL 66182]|nr:hypothetical protein F66182_18129 [Fusarium sp. NRRL 66182]
MATRTVLILGSGPRIGDAVSEKFAADGYKVALVSRKGTNSINEKGYLSLQADFANTDPSIIASIFDKVKSEFNAPPSVVIYNAGSITPPPDENSARVTNDLNVNVVSPYIAAQEAIKHWESLPTEDKKLFIYTGNITNVAIVPVPLLLNAGMGKSAAAYWLGVADGAYAAKGYRFIYADQRQPDGKLAGPTVSGPAHADFFSQLAASGAENVPWHATFVKDKGYVKF